MSKTSRTKGHAAEDLACKFLIGQGWEILERNYYYGKAEIDIIAKNKEFLIFVEVKMRSTPKFGYPIEFVDDAKVERIFRAAEHWAQTHAFTHIPLRFDIIGILNKKGDMVEITHIPDAYR